MLAILNILYIVFITVVAAVSVATIFLLGRTFYLVQILLKLSDLNSKCRTVAIFTLSAYKPLIHYSTIF
jgi:hypothetical protein